MGRADTNKNECSRMVRTCVHPLHSSSDGGAGKPSLEGRRLKPVHISHLVTVDNKLNCVWVMLVKRFIEDCNSISWLHERPNAFGVVSISGHFHHQIVQGCTAIERINDREPIARQLRLGDSEKSALSDGNGGSDTKSGLVCAEVGAARRREPPHECISNTIAMDSMLETKCGISAIPQGLQLMKVAPPVEDMELFAWFKNSATNSRRRRR